MKIWVGLIQAGEFCKAFERKNEAEAWLKSYHELSKVLYDQGFDLTTYELDEKQKEFFGMEMLDTASDEIEIKEVELN